MNLKCGAMCEPVRCSSANLDSPTPAVSVRPGSDRQLFSLSTRIALLFVVLSITSSLAFAAATGTISGLVQDASGAVIPDVSVRLTCVETGVVQTVRTDAADRAVRSRRPRRRSGRSRRLRRFPG